MTRGWAITVAHILGVSVTTHGLPPTPPFFLVANHLSYLDIICFSTLLDCVFIAKSEVAEWPILGSLARSVDTIFIDRTHYHDIPRAISLIERAMGQGNGIILFPEGTSTKGDQVLPFRPGLLEPAARLDLPVSLAAISYRTPPRQKPAFLSVCWWGEMAFLPHFLQMLQLSSCEASIHFGAQAIRNEDRKVLGRQLWTAVSKEFVPLITAQEEQEVLLRNPEYFPARY